MFLLIIFSFVAGLVTILSPCILPVLPIILANSVTEGKKKPFGIIIGFIGSFTFFTLSLSTIVKVTGLPPDILRIFAIFIVGGFGLSMVIPKFQIWMEQVLSKLTGFAPKQTHKNGYLGGVVTGISLGLLWAPCVGPILASIITIAATSTITAASVFITLSYSLGTAIPMFCIVYGGRSIFDRVPWLISNTGTIQKFFGIIMMITSIAMYFNIDRTFQTYILQKFPNYGVGLTQFEENRQVQQALESITKKTLDTQNIGKPMNDVLDSQIGGAPEFIISGEWINTKPLTMKELRGKVVLVDFWTYTCINCIRTLPYIKKWHEMYKDKGLVIVGVHTPEFAFERETKNVQKAVKDFGITYPIMQDNDYATWNAYANHYWPAKYLIDKNGKIRNTHFGEGKYDETEQFIQKLLKETGVTITEKPNNAQYQIHTNSPESYLGADRIAYLVSPETLAPNKQILFTKPSTLEKNTFAYAGNWTIDSEYAMPEKGATLTYRFDAQTVYIVMKQKQDGTPGRIRVTIDGKDLDESNRTQDSIDSIVTVNGNRLYTLVSLQEQGEHVIELQFLDNNSELFAFTFG